MGDRTDLDLIPVPAHREVCKPVIFGLTAAGAHGDLPAGCAGQRSGLGGLGQGADLVHFEQERVGGACAHRPPDALGVGAEQVVAEDQGAAGQALLELRPMAPIVFGQAVFQADDRVAFDQVGQEGDHARAVDPALTKVVAVPVVEVARGHVQGECHVRAGAQSRRFDGADRVLQHGFGARKGWGQAALVGGEFAHAVAAFGKVGCRAVDGVGHLEYLTDGPGRGRHDQHVLDGNLPTGVLAAAEEVDGGTG